MININVYEILLKRLNDLLYCENKCDSCSCQMMDEGDEKPWCGFESILRSSISCIEYLNKIDD